MFTVTVVEAKERLPELLEQVRCGEEIVIVQNDVPAAKLVSADRPGYGCLQGQIVMADDFDAPLEDFEAYLP